MIFKNSFLVLVAIFILTINLIAADGDLDVSFDGDGRVVASLNSTTSFEVLEDMAIQPDGKIVAAGTQFITASTSSQQFIVFRLNTDGSPDQTFGTNGAATIKPSANNTNGAEALVIQADGKILIGGTGQGSFLLARLNADGSPDATFDGDGKLEITGLGGLGALAIDRQTGKIYAGGQGIVFSPSTGYAFTVYRLNANGSVDTTFGTNGRVNTPVGFSGIGSFGNFVDGLAIQADGKIVAVGESQTNSSSSTTDFTVLRYNANGALDTTFDGDGIVRTTFGTSRSRALEVALQPDGKIVVLGDQDQTQTNQDLTIVRYNSDGSLDGSFGSGGKAVNLGVNTNIGDLAIQPDGKIVFVSEKLAGATQTRFFVGRLTTSGVLDVTFGSNGSLTTEFGDTVIGGAIALQTDGKLVAGGTVVLTGQSFNQRKFGLVRYLNSASNPPVNNPALRIADFDGDGKTDASVFRNGNWFINPSSNPSSLAPSAFYGIQFGLSTDRLAPADYDGDGKTDVAVWRESEGRFYILNSSNNSVRTENFGLQGDVLTNGDWDGDGKADLSTYREGAQSYFFYRGSLNNPNGNITYLPWGTSGDKAVRGDFDGDRKLDTAVFRPSNNTWYIRQSSDNQIVYRTFGLSTDKRVSGDFDGDGKTDICVFRDGVWYILQSSNDQIIYRTWGANTDMIAAGDYDGDGKTDVAVWRNGIYYVLNSSNSAANYQYFGASGDRIVASAFIQ